MNLIEARNICKIFELGRLVRRKIVAVENVSFSIPNDKPLILTLAGESGSGKTTTARMILGFIKPTSGEILYKNKNIWHMSKDEWTKFHRDVQAIFQDPYGSFNPLRKVDRILTVPIRKFKLASSKDEEQELIAKALANVGLETSKVLGKYPHELSGGQRQRIMLARAFLIKPKLIVADEPVSMIDASLRANILNTMVDLKKKLGISFLYITHDLSTARYISDEIIIMYLGNITEMGPIDDVVLKPLHPYVKLLVDSVPKPNPDERWREKIELPRTELSKQAIQMKGCKFYSRCPERMDKCLKEKPKLIKVHRKLVACHLYA